MPENQRAHKQRVWQAALEPVLRASGLPAFDKFGLSQEGISKLQGVFEMSAAEEITSVKDMVSEEEWQLRVDLAATYRLVAMHGWDDMIFTHISVRVPGPEHHFLINPYGMLFEEITASSLVKIDLEGNIVMDSPYFVIQPVLPFTALFSAREDAQCVLHLHTDDGVAVSAQKTGCNPSPSNPCC